MPDCKVFGVPESTYTWSVCMALHEKGVPYELVPCEPGSEAAFQVHPFGRVPALQWGDFDVFETAAILQYIDEIFEAPPLSPGRIAGRTLMRQWMSAISDYVYPTLIQGVIAAGALEPDPRGPIQASAARAREHLSVFDEVLGGQPFLAGGHFSLADILLAPMVHLAEQREHRSLLRGFEHLARWSRGVQARPSFVETRPPLPGPDTGEGGRAG